MFLAKNSPPRHETDLAREEGRLLQTAHQSRHLHRGKNKCRSTRSGNIPSGQKKPNARDCGKSTGATMVEVLFLESSGSNLLVYEISSR